MAKYPVFTEEMKKTHKILVPNMLPIHFRLIINVFKHYGYDMELLTTDSRNVIDEGLKNVHNDTCYPALLVIGQFFDALKSGKYNPDTTALLISQTGGGCRASNYIHLLRKALSEQYPQVPVLSLNFSGFDTNGLKLSPDVMVKLLYGILYGDLLMLLYNQCKPYELIDRSTDRVLDIWQKKLDKIFAAKKYTNTKKYFKEILDSFAKLERSSKKKIKVGIVGEIYVKYSPLANNGLEKFLLSEGCEPVVPSMLDFVLYCAVNTVNAGKFYDYKNKTTFFYKIGYDFIYNMQKKMIKTIKEHGVFEPPHDFEHLRKYADKYIHQGVVMGEGWLIPAEMAALAESGTENIICAQPFGCLPNHIVAKGMSRAIKEGFPNANIVAIDYDPGATKVNQENRIKLMLASARSADNDENKVL